MHTKKDREVQQSYTSKYKNIQEDNKHPNTHLPSSTSHEKLFMRTASNEVLRCFQNVFTADIKKNITDKQRNIRELTNKIRNF